MQTIVFRFDVIIVWFNQVVRWIGPQFEGGRVLRNKLVLIRVVFELVNAHNVNIMLGSRGVLKRFVFLMYLLLAQEKCRF